MPRVSFTQNLRRHVDCDEITVAGSSVAEALDAVFAGSPRLRGYILNDQGAVHRHVAILVNSQAVADRTRLDVPVSEEDEILILQALSGG